MGPLHFSDYPGLWEGCEKNTGHVSGPEFNHCLCHSLALWLWSLCPYGSLALFCFFTPFLLGGWVHFAMISRSF